MANIHPDPSHALKWTTDDPSEPLAVTNFRRYLRCQTVQPTPDYASAQVLLTHFGRDLGLAVAVHEPVKGKPVILLTWQDADPKLKSLVLNSHIDVVPVFPELWTQDPWAADKVDGRIYARGAQDMKCVGIQYLEAIRELKRKGWAPKRTVHVMFVPDEEIGGKDGMEKFIETSAWKELRPALVLDEGLGNDEDKYKVYHGERAPWWIEVTASGETGHGSQFIPDTAGPKLNKAIARLLAFRDQQEHLFKTGTHAATGKPYTLGDVTTLNLTLLSGGVQHNVLPTSLSAKFDIRITPNQKLADVRALIDDICAESGCTWSFVQETKSNHVTPLAGNPWWRALEAAAAEHGVELDPTIFPAATDSRFVRRARVPAFGVSPMRKTPVLLHCHDEYLEEKVFVEGIEFYVKLLPKLDAVGVEEEAEVGTKWTVEC
ncbi:hypothetical protein BCR44DRAFT_61677 [Catenaria anguillulae PL171]|uniref:N-acyl-aliphatic-L-amino acid amidohydrolase n=1 Tax=Catenaria anguillulae PL171 TaxID=765915 RepID=A0A1Y2H5D5_9FUNG|nr:hypothetical protein BCR44DRAFT_61677 [Catenaria anguillulae PL171]